MDKQKYSNYLLAIYLLFINLLGFVLYGIDKAKSKRKGSRRIPERTLLWWRAWVGEWAAGSA